MTVDISNELNTIKSTQLGRTMRSALHDSIKKQNKELNRASALIDEFIKNAQQVSLQNEEIVAARIDNTSDIPVPYETLGMRLDKMKEDSENKVAILNENLEQTNAQLSVVADRKLDKNGIVTMANMGQDVKEAMTGGSVAIVGKDTILTDNIIDLQVTPSKTSFAKGVISGDFSKPHADVNWSELGSMYHLETGNIVSTQYTTDYSYSDKISCEDDVTYSVPTRNGQVLFWNNESYLGNIDIEYKGTSFTPLLGSTKMAFNLKNITDKYDVVLRNTPKDDEYERVIIDKLIVTSDNINKAIIDENVDGDTFIKYPYLQQNDDLNHVMSSGRYFAINATNMPTSTGSFMIEVKEFKTLEENPTFILQEAIEFLTNKRFTRQIYQDNITEWIEVGSKNKNSRFKKIVNFGDSIFGNFNDSTSISSYIEERLNTPCFNAGFGGCRMTDRDEIQWNPFGMCNIADAVSSGDWSLQDAQINDSSLPSYFKGKLNQLKQINFNEVDIVTIAYGTNDYYSIANFDNVSDMYDRKTLCGALRYSVKTLLNSYPHLKILIISPIWRGGISSESFDSDVRNFGSGTLIDYYKGMEKVCAELKIPFLNSYINSGIGLITKPYYFDDSDFTHPNDKGRKRYADLIASTLESVF